MKKLLIAVAVLLIACGGTTEPECVYQYSFCGPAEELCIDVSQQEIADIKADPDWPTMKENGWHFIRKCLYTKERV